MSERVSPWLQTFTGRTFRLLEPTADMFHLEDIAHHLAFSTRFNGATRQAYSIAEHCVHVSRLVPEKYAREGLGHEIAEPYTGDIAYPVKCALEIVAPGALKSIDGPIERAGADRYGLIYPWPDAVKAADLAMLVAERDTLMMKPHNLWDVDDANVRAALGGMIDSGKAMIRCWTPAAAEVAFLHRWAELYQ